LVQVAKGLQSRSRFLNPGILDWGVSNPGIPPGLLGIPEIVLNPGIIGSYATNGERMHKLPK